MDEREEELRETIVAGGRRLGARGLIVAGEGNLSVRLDDGRILVTPSGARKDELVPGDVLAVALDEPAGAPAVTAPAATPAGVRPSSDLAIHRAVLRARPDVGAVAHAHVPASLALTLGGEVPDPAVLPETARFLPRLPFLPYAEPGSAVLADRIAAALSDGLPAPVAVLLERHGAVAVGRTVAEAVDRLELVDLLCRVWLAARTIAPNRTFGPPEA